MAQQPRGSMRLIMVLKLEIYSQGDAGQQRRALLRGEALDGFAVDSAVPPRVRQFDGSEGICCSFFVM